MVCGDRVVEIGLRVSGEGEGERLLRLSGLLGLFSSSDGRLYMMLLLLNFSVPTTTTTGTKADSDEDSRVIEK